MAKRLNTGLSTVITPVLMQRVCNLAWYCMDRDRRGIPSLGDGEVTSNLLDDCAENMRGEKLLKDNTSTKKEPGKIKLEYKIVECELSSSVKYSSSALLSLSSEKSMSSTKLDCALASVHKLISNSYQSLLVIYNAIRYAWLIWILYFSCVTDVFDMKR